MKERAYMKLFQITKFELLERITILANHHDDAANILISAIEKGLGKSPILEYEVTRWKPRLDSKRPTLHAIVDRNQRGFAWESDDHRWSFTDPFTDWQNVTKTFE